MQFKVTKQGTAPPYEAVYNITQSYLLDSDGDLDWEFLMIEVKYAKGIRYAYGFNKGNH